jgi:hypothetical protein
MSAVVYLRVPDALKQALDAHAHERGLSLTQAARELIERGLEQPAAGKPVSERQGTPALASGELEKTRARLKQAELGLRAAREREQLTARTYAAFAERARHELASCPGCHKPLRGSDLVVSGHCPHCETALTQLLLPTRIGSLVVNEYSALLGALGVLAGLAISTSAENAG